MITSLGLKTIRRLKKSIKSRYAITNVSAKYLSKNIKELEDLTYEGHVQKSSKHVPTDSYFYLSRKLAKCMMRFNMCNGPARTQMNTTQKMNNSEISMQNIPNLQGFSSDESKSKEINVDKSLSHFYFTDKSE